MTDDYPVEATGQAVAKSNSLTQSSTLTSNNSLSTSSASSVRPQQRHFLSLDSLEATSSRILTRIRSRSPLPRASSPQPPPPDTETGRSPSPPPSVSSPAAVQLASPSSPSSIDLVHSPTSMSPVTSHYPPHTTEKRRKRFSDVSSSTVDSSGRSRSDSYKRYSGTVNHYGRHSNDWLFGGFSVRDALRDGIDKLRGHGERDN